jgi:hypothetical protein
VKSVHRDEFERIRKEAGVPYVKAISQHFPGENEENHDKLQSVYPVDCPTFESGTS